MASKENRSDFKQIRKGDFLSETQYYEVKNVTPDQIAVVNERGFEFNIGRAIVEEGLFSATQFTETVKVSRTELIEIFHGVGDTVFQVCFNKQPTADAINEAIESANKGKILPINELKRLVKQAYKGEERILIGYLVKTETGFGRSMVIDLEANTSKSTPEWDSRLRQVDHRTLNWLIYKNIKYEVK